MFPKLAAALFTLMPLAFPAWGQALVPIDFVCGVTNEPTPVKEAALATVPGVARTGARSALVVRVDFTNAPGAVISETQAIVQLGAVDAFFRSTSFQQLSLPVVAVTPLLRLPGNASFYAGNLAELTEQGRLAAEAAGFPSAAYDFVIYSFPTIGAPFTAIGQVNGQGVWVQGDNFKAPILAHELGHNLGLPHANAWFTPDDSIAGFGYVIQYGNRFDLMGNSPFGLSAEYNANFRYLLGWLHDTDIHVATASGVYRIFAIDYAQPLDVSKRFALRVPASLTLAGLPHDYWIDARQANHDRTADGVLLKAGAAQLDYSGNLLLDTTPGSLGGLGDSPLVLGRTYADFDRSIFITPINRGSKDDNVFYDIEVNLGVTNNQNPEVTISASILATNTSRQITFSASASDPDGDELSYFWDFGDETIASKLDKATVSKSWSQRGAYRVQCTVSDRKGGFASRSLIVQIGTSPNFTVSGQARVGKKLLGGVRVHNGRPGIENRYAFTDSDGSYTLTELPAGTHTLQAVKAGLNFDLVTVGVGPNATNIDLVALPAVEPFITAITPDHGEPGTTVTISGVNFSGTAAVRFGEVSAAFVVVSSRQITATVPAGNFTANISVTTTKGSDTNEQAFTIDVPQPPFITAFVPGHGQPGSTVNISGLNLARVTSVRFGNVSAPFGVASPTTITATVPSGATTAPITITTPGGTITSTDAFVIDPPPPPTIISFTPTHGEPGFTVTISGAFFSGATSVRFGDVNAPFTAVSSTLIRAIVPAGAITAPLFITTSNGTTTSANAFIVDPVVVPPSPPSIASFTPSHGAPGSTVTIFGTNFSGATSVRFGALFAEFTLMSTTQAMATVPSNASTAVLSITTPNGTASSSNAFIVDLAVEPPSSPPVITSFTPDHGLPGTAVFINGENFFGVISVRFGGVTALSSTVVFTNLIVTLVPAGAPSATISVTTPNGAIASTNAFIVDLVPSPFAPLITGWIPRHGEPGTSVLIVGTNFSNTTDVRFGGVNAAFTVISSTAITTIVPAGASTAPFSITTTNGSAVSTEAFVIDDPQPVALIAQPQNMALAEGSNGVFVVTASGTSPLGFQWRKDGTNIPGATASSLAMTNAQLESEGGYSVMITNPLGSLVSTTALLTVLTLGRAVEQPALAWSTSAESPWFGQTNVWLDDSSSGPDGSIDTGGGDGPVRGYSAQSGGRTNDSWIETTVSGPLLLSFWWQLSARFFDETLDFSIDGLRQAQIKGSRNWSQYSIPLSDGPHALRWTRHARQPGTSGWLDQIRTTGNWFTSQPQGTNILAGDALNLAATAGSPANFQWERDGLLLADATNSMLHLTSITPAEEGDYRVIIAYNGTSVTSVVAHVTVQPLAITLPPADQDVIATSNALFRVEFVSRLPAQTQWLFNDQPIPGATNQNLTFRAMPTNAGLYQAVVANNYGALTSAPAALFVDSGPPSILNADANYAAYAGERVILQTPVDAAPPPTYRWMHNRRAVRGATNAALVFPRIQRVQAGDYFLIAQNPFGAITQRIHVTVRSLVIKQQPVSQEVLVEDPLHLSVEAGNTAGFGPLKYQWRFNGISLPGATNQALLFPSAQVPNSGDYDVVVRARLGYPRLTSSIAQVTVTGSAPAFDTEPQDQQRKFGESTRFIALASGRPAPSYQWHFNGVPMPAARRPTLTISPVTTESAGAYFVIASNQFGSATSQLAQLFVLEGPPNVKNFPGDFAAVAGDFIALREINGVSPPATNYQWTFQAPGLEATNIPGATNSIFIIPVIAEAQAGKYRLLARNALGEELSSGTDIAVRPPLALDLWQWNSPRPQGNDLLGAAVGHGVFLAVGAAGAQIRATNSVSWIDHSFLTKDEAPAAVFAADRFMILLSEKDVEQNDVGTVLLVSTNALDWAPTTLPIVDTIQNLRTANGRFFAAGGDALDGLVICVSEDGSGWSQSPIPLPMNKLSVAYGAGQYVALSGPQVLLSSDATNWDLGPLLGDARDLCFGNDTFVAVGSAGQVWSSTNGLNWTGRLSGTGKDLFVAGFGMNRFFGAGEDGKMITSIDGANWSSVNSHTSRDLHAFAAGDERVALFGVAGAVVSSTNGVFWVDHTQAATTADLLEVVFTNNTFVAVGDSGTVLRSIDGLAWIAQNAGTGKDLNSIAPTPNGFVAVGEDGKILTSPNAQVWTEQASPEDKSLRRVAYLNDLYVAVGDDGAIVTSANGTEWFARSATLPGPGTLEGIAYGNGLFIAVGGFNDVDGFAASVIVTSPDGVTWTAQTPNFGKKLRNITFVDGRFMGVGNDGLIVHSEDGLSWRRQLIANPLENLRALHALPGLLVIVGNDGVVFSSPDGDTWQRHRSFTAKNLHSIAFGQNKLVAVGSDGAILQSDGILPVLDTQRTPAGLQLAVKGGTHGHYHLQTSKDAIVWSDAGFLTNGMPFLLGTNECESACNFFRLRSP